MLYQPPFPQYLCASYAYIHSFFALFYWFLQGFTDEYGIDWSGPASLDDDQTVTVDNLPSILSDEECTTLRQQLTHSDTLTEEWMVHSFTVAKVFIHAAAQN